jgi:hypothetical protein
MWIVGVNWVFQERDSLEETVGVPRDRHSANIVPYSFQSDSLPMIAFFLKPGNTLLEFTDLLYLSFTTIASCKSIPCSLLRDGVGDALDIDIR